MPIDLRCRHDREARELAADMFESVTYNFLRTLTAA